MIKTIKFTIINYIGKKLDFSYIINNLALIADILTVAKIAYDDAMSAFTIAESDMRVAMVRAEKIKASINR